MTASRIAKSLHTHFRPQGHRMIEKKGGTGFESTDLQGV